MPKKLVNHNKSSKREVTFDEASRREFVTGFRKRKDKRRKVAQQQQKVKEKEQKKQERHEKKQAFEEVANLHSLKAEDDVFFTADLEENQEENGGTETAVVEPDEVVYDTPETVTTVVTTPLYGGPENIDISSAKLSLKSLKKINDDYKASSKKQDDQTEGPEQQDQEEEEPTQHLNPSFRKKKYIKSSVTGIIGQQKRKVRGHAWNKAPYNHKEVMKNRKKFKKSSKKSKGKVSTKGSSRSQKKR